MTVAQKIRIEDLATDLLKDVPKKTISIVDTSTVDRDYDLAYTGNSEDTILFVMPHNYRTSNVDMKRNLEQLVGQVNCNVLTLKIETYVKGEHHDNYVEDKQIEMDEIAMRKSRKYDAYVQRIINAVNELGFEKIRLIADEDLGDSYENVTFIPAK